MENENKKCYVLFAAKTHHFDIEAEFIGIVTTSKEDADEWLENGEGFQKSYKEVDLLD